MTAHNAGGEPSPALREKGKAHQHLETKTAAAFLAILALLTLIGWLYLIQVSKVTTASYRLQELYAEKERLQRKNTLLRLQIAELERLDNLQARASALGFIAPARIEYLAVVNYPLPSPPQALSAATSTPPSTGGEKPRRTSGLAHWWKEISAQFADWAGVP